jgi:hypothetical protein
MDINNLRIQAKTDLESSSNELKQIVKNYLGLFATIYEDEKGNNGNVRSLTLDISQVLGAGVTSVGVLAGEISDGRVANVKVVAENEKVIVTGKHMAGGIAGIVRGDSYLVNVQSDVNVQANHYSMINTFDPAENSMEIKPNSGIFHSYNVYVSGQPTEKYTNI